MTNYWTVQMDSLFFGVASCTPLTSAVPLLCQAVPHCCEGVPAGVPVTVNKTSSHQWWNIEQTRHWAACLV